ncbi:MAG TPA: lipase family protein [Niastella sp.]|nr:lipase family protein [Niastella sp.]
MKMAKTVLFVLSCWFSYTTFAQNLKAGFDKAEYIELIRAYSRWGDSVFYKGIEASTRFRPVYRSSVVGLDNSWQLYRSEDNMAVISIRGTTKNATSWLANFYSAMVPAKGVINISDSVAFNYELAKDPKAAVHVGWLVATAFLSADMLPRIDSCYKAGVRDFIILGHSQGGAIAYLLTSYLHNLVEQGRLPKDIHLKTYCSAAPKPGNLYYAYEFEHQTAGGWSFNVINAADWVPETPISIQTVNDFNTINPFINAPKLIRKQKFPQRLFFKHLYSQLTKHAARAQRRYERYLGRMTSRYVKKQYPQFKEPVYYHSSNYVRVSNSVVLMPDSAYYELYPNDDKRMFGHHSLQAYLWLAGKL